MESVYRNSPPNLRNINTYVQATKLLQSQKPLSISFWKPEDIIRYVGATITLGGTAYFAVTSSITPATILGIATTAIAVAQAYEKTFGALSKTVDSFNTMLETLKNLLKDLKALQLVSEHTYSEITANNAESIGIQVENEFTNDLEMKNNNDLKKEDL